MSAPVSSKRLLAAALLIIGLYWLPYLILWDNSFFLIHDDLDSVFVWHKTLVESGLAFAPNGSAVSSFMDGAPRSSFPSELNFTVLWFWLFGPLGAYVFERGLFAVTGFFGMYHLLRSHVTVGHESRVIQVGVALCYGLLPFWPFGGLSVAGLPFLAYAFLNLRAGRTNAINWLIIAAYPFYSSLVTTGVFFIAAAVALAGWDAIKARAFSKPFVLGILLLCLLFVVSHYRLFVTFLWHPSHVSHRVEFITDPQGLSASFRAFVDIFVFGQRHAHSLHTYVILPTLVLSMIVARKAGKFPRKFWLLLLFVLLTSLFCGFLDWSALTKIREAIFSRIPIQLQRFHWLHPACWCVLFAIGLNVLMTRCKAGFPLVVLLIATQCAIAVSHHEILRNRAVGIPYRAFFAQKLFADVKSHIGKPVTDYRVVSLGIHPSIAQFNGFYTLDGYLADYPLEYKHRFRKIIAAELASNEKNRAYFDNWGSRAYILPRENIGYLNKKGNTVVLKRLDLDVAAFKAMGGEYILSSVRIDPIGNPQYELVRQFAHRDSAWDIYLYKVN